MTERQTLSQSSAPALGSRDGTLWIALAALSHLVLASAAFETFRSGSPVRWWVLGILCGYAGVLFAVWRVARSVWSRSTPHRLAALGGGLFLGMLALTAWLPTGTTDGVRLFGQKSSTLLAALSAAAICAAGVSIARVRDFPGWARVAIGTLAAYGATSFILGIVSEVPFGSVLRGHGFWTPLPFWLQGTFVGGLVVVPVALAVELVRVITHLRRRQQVEGLLHRAMALTMVLAIVLAGVRPPLSLRTVSGPAAVVAGPAGASKPRDWQEPPSQEQVNIARQALESIDNEISGDTFDAGAVVRSVGRDPVRLFEWVRDNTYWVPYHGALRGPVGVLMDRLGNSLDRSLLLAELLRVAGHKVQLARGVIPDARARELLAQLRPVPQVPDSGPTSADVADAGATIDRYAMELQIDGDELRREFIDMTVSSRRIVEELHQRVAQQAPFLANLVGESTVEDAVSRGAVTALSDHWWVQKADESRWVDLDPLVPNTPAATAQAKSDETVAFDRVGVTIPLDSRFAHEVTFRVIAEQWKSGQLAEKVALEHTVRPAEVIGEQMVFHNLPLSWPIDSGSFLQQENPAEALAARAMEQREWLPRLTIGNRSVSQLAVSDSGELRAPSPTPPLGRNPGASLGAALDALGGEDTAPAQGFLTAEWIEYEIRVPGQTPRKFRRAVFDLLGLQARSGHVSFDAAADDRGRAARALGLIGSIEILPMVCRLAPDYIAHLAVARAKRSVEATPELFGKLAEGQIGAAVSTMLRPTSPSSRLLDLASTRFASNQAASAIYLDSPNILSYRSQWTYDAKGQIALAQGFDIVANYVAVQAASTMPPFLARVTQGVADTNAEAVLIGKDAVNAGNLLAAIPAPARWTAVRSARDIASFGSTWPAEVRAQLEAAVRSGVSVVVPRGGAASGTSEHWAWWTVDARTGETLGRGRQGWGEGSTETSVLGYLTQQAVLQAVSVTFASGFFFFWACMTKRAIMGDLSGGSEGLHLDLVKREAAVCGCEAIDVGVTVGAAVASKNVSGLAAGYLVGKVAQKLICK